eukprot:6483140-Amphidinium_carterae.1
MVTYSVCAHCGHVVGQAEMLRKNAFALLGKHRFFLAAALFHLGGFVEEHIHSQEAHAIVVVHCKPEQK